MSAILYEVTLLKGAAPIVISSQLNHIPGKQPEVADPRGTRALAGRILLPEFHRDTEMRVMLGHVTRMSRQRLASGIDHEIETDCPLRIEHRSGEESGAVIFSVEATEAKPIRLVKFMTYHNSRSAGAFSRSFGLLVISGAPYAKRLRRR
jgi:alpha,alpha-trehalose phosphorylase